MTDRGPLYDHNETPEDVATLYSWANLHGAKYRDFSESRAVTRENARLRVLQAIEEEQARAKALAGSESPAEIQNIADLEHAAEMRRMAEVARAQEEAHIAELEEQRAAQEAAQRAARETADRAAQEAAQLAAQQAAREAAQRAAQQAAQEAAQRAADQAAREAAQRAAEQAAQDAAHRAAEQAARETAQRAAEQAARETAQRAAEQAARQASELAALQAAKQAELEAAREAAERAAQQQAAQRAAQHAELEATRLAAEKAAQQLAAQRAALQAQAAQDAAERARELAALQAEQQAARQAAEYAAQLKSAQQAAEEAARRAAWQQPLAERLAAIPTVGTAPQPTPYAPPRIDFPDYVPPAAQAQKPPSPAAMHEDSYLPPQSPWTPSDPLENTGRPAWLTPDRPSAAPHQAASQAPEDTLQGSRDRLASRWFALRSVFEGVGAPVEAAPAPQPARAPAVAVFSLAGGVGKTSLVATLGRALSARGERVLLVDTAPFGLLPFFFGARDQRPGLLRTFSPPGTSADAPIQMVTVDPEGMNPDAGGHDALTAEIGNYSRGMSRVIVDLATASGATTRRVLRMSPLVLVPLVPDMNSVVSFSSIDSFFQHNGNPTAKPSLPFYVLNQFDPSLPLHLDIREVLREQLGDRLLPFVLRRAPAVSEALAEGMTVMDYAPNSTVAEDYGSLAGWVKSQSAPATSAYRGVRWSER
jgi:cellulose synthase operon protein YhjQ